LLARSIDPDPPIVASTSKALVAESGRPIKPVVDDAPR